MDLKAQLLSEAARVGFFRARVASVDTPLAMVHYDAFLSAGWHGEMDWLVSGRDERADVRRLLPGAQSVVVLAFDYGHALPPDPGGATGRVASYAWGRDYHNFVLKRLRKLQSWLRRAHGLDSYASLDTRPVYERAWADRAGLGFRGRNACQILPGETSQFFLATLLLAEALPPDPPLGDHCGRCRRCVDACPTAAILPEGGLVATRCISYFTIEADEPVPVELRPRLGRWLFGCDDCQTVCPHLHPSPHPAEETRPRHAWVSLPELLDCDDDALRVRFAGTPLRRAAGPRLRRNAAYVLGNLRAERARAALERATRRGRVEADAAEWALAQLGD